MTSSSSTAEHIPVHERHAVGIPEGCDYTGLGRSEMYRLISRGEIATVKHGRRRLILVASLVAWAECNLAATDDGSAPS